MLLRLKDIGLTYDNGHSAIADINLDIPKGQLVTLLGPSGCGKTTLLKVIGGLLVPSAGQLDWADQNHPQALSYVFQDPTLMPWATISDNVFLPLRLAGKKKSDVRGDIDQALAQVGLSEFSNAYPRQLSGGMQMRVSIARALVTRPNLILMDEPFAALDEINRFKLNDDLLNLKQQTGCTIIFVTHSVYEAAYLSDQVVVMGERSGRVAHQLTISTEQARNSDYRQTSIYQNWCRKVSQALSDAAGEPH